MCPSLSCATGEPPQGCPDDSEASNRENTRGCPSMKGLLVGYGSIGRRHLANLHALGVEEWAVVHTGMGTLPFEPPCPVTTYPDVLEALGHEEPTFAVIANPTNLHVPAALACLQAGCHLLIEKPVSGSLDGLDALTSLAATSERQVLVGFQFRFHPALRRIRELLRGGAVGAALHARVVWGEHLPSWHPWEDWRGSYAARLDLGGGCPPYDLPSARLSPDALW